MKTGIAKQDVLNVAMRLKCHVKQDKIQSYQEMTPGNQWSSQGQE